MIVKADDTLNQRIVDYLDEEKAMNLFILGDIENFGYKSDFQDIWVDIGNGGDIKGIMLRYFGNYLPYAKESINAEGFSKVIKDGPPLEMLSGKKEIVEQFQPVFSFTAKKDLYFAELEEKNFTMKGLGRDDLTYAAVDDADDIIEMHNSIKEFQRRETARESLVQTLTTKTGRSYFIKKDGKMVASAATTAENSRSAMVVGVCTHVDYRQQGLASRCTAVLCEDVLNEGKILCLFYDNPRAGSIYKRMGFQDIGMWSMYSK
ncbi:GNAT family N-acetyltransferase [Fictibacillus fluitans]|uniref:GNAT family N-acetyltransferase n=1 Tax=Fictibacillus fluitans TaxID=3058422 RepID=A0ABT8HSJ5_9BACL|nr:GNAT family N-acetyltransferase [Fictibacillus sp. NE201]MDN4523747.1 GNAT family N-acetyltransferase [Fictibacillus sp. NE201]